MDLQKIIKKYPYKEVRAVIVKVLYSRSEDGYVPEYDKEDAIEDLKVDERGSLYSRNYSSYDIYDKVSRHSNENLGIVEEDFWGNPVSCVYRHWYNQKLLIEYEDLQGHKHKNEIEISSENGYSSGEFIAAFYLIDNPDEVITEDYMANTIDSYIHKQNILNYMILMLILILAIIIACLKYRL
jgi:hypothetical protein